jgi:WD40 repeat protein
VIELYDGETGKRLLDLKEGNHCNKIFCAKFDRANPNMIYSGGWDRAVLLWDVRQGRKTAAQI